MKVGVAVKGGTRGGGKEGGGSHTLAPKLYVINPISSQVVKLSCNF